MATTTTSMGLMPFVRTASQNRDFDFVIIPREVDKIYVFSHNYLSLAELGCQIRAYFSN